MEGGLAYVLSKSYTKKTAEGMGAVKGKDGFSPIATVEETADGAVITITDKNGTTSATVKGGGGEIDKGNEMTEQDVDNAWAAVFGNGG